MDRLFEEFDLDHKVNRFINEYKKELRQKDILTDIGQYCAPQQLRDHIEAKAVFAELRHPYPYRTNPVTARRQAQVNSRASEQFSWSYFDKHDDIQSIPLLQIDPSDIDTMALYRIIERGGARSGGRRGLQFADEFGLDINIPASYLATDLSDPHLYDALEPILDKLDMDTRCPVGYFSRSSSNMSHLTPLPLREILTTRALNKNIRTPSGTTPSQHIYAEG